MSEKEIKNDRIKLNDIVAHIKLLVLIIKKNYVLYICILFIGFIISIVFNFKNKTQYIAECTFIIDENNKFSSSQYSNIASLVGIDLSANTNNLFQSDNIMELYKSNMMLRKTLLTKSQLSGGLLINNFLSTQKKQLLSVNQSQRSNDSIINESILQINKKYFKVEKVDKQSSIISVTFKFPSEIFAKEFVTTVVNNVNNFYTTAKTKRYTENIKILTGQSDSIRNILNKNLNKSVAAIDQNPNPNPLRQFLKVPNQKAQIDVQSNLAIYSEIVKNLEVSKLSLLQEKPIIQIIDNPVLPLQKQKTSIMLVMVVSVCALSFLITIYLLLRHYLIQADTKTQ